MDAESRPGRPRLSLEYQRPNAELIGERFALTVALTLFAFVFTWAVAIPAGIYSATHPRSALDYVFTVLNYVGVATPNFMLALVLMWGAFAYFGVSVTGLFSPEFVEAPWSGRRVLDLLAHIWLAAVVLGVAGTARLMGVMRANLLDELHKPYVTTARAKGLSEWRLVWRYPVRLALNPLVSTIGGYLRLLFAGSLIVATIRIWVDNLWEFGTIGRTPMVQGVVRRQLALPQRPDHARQRLAPAQPRQRAPGAVLLRPVGRRALRSCRAGVSRARGAATASWRAGRPSAAAG